MDVFVFVAGIERFAVFDHFPYSRCESGLRTREARGLVLRACPAFPSSVVGKCGNEDVHCRSARGAPRADIETGVYLVALEDDGTSGSALH